MSFALFLALRLIRSPSLDRSLLTMSRLCFIGIFIATCSLTLIAAVIRGLQEKTAYTLQQMAPDLMIRSKQRYLNYAKIDEVLTSEFSDTIERSSPLLFSHALLEQTGQTQDFSTMLTLVILDPSTFFQVTPIPLLKNCDEQIYIPHKLGPQELLLGQGALQQLGLKCNDTITLCYPDDEDSSSSQVTLLRSNAKIVAVFATGLDEWDDRVAFISTSYAQELGVDITQIQQINLKLHPGVSRDVVQKRLNKRLQLPILSWYDLNPAVVSALHLEALATFFILCLIILITSITTMSLLSMHLLYHQHTIALLYSFGASRTQLSMSFTLMGTFLACSAALCGISFAALLSYLIDHYQLISLPALYYSNYVPARMSFDLAGGTFLITGCMTICATWYAARRIKTMPLARILAN